MDTYSIHPISVFITIGYHFHYDSTIPFSISDNKCQPLLMFSILTNGKKIFTCENVQSPNVIQCLHGIRSLTTLYVIAGHSGVVPIMFPTRNLAEYLEVNTKYTRHPQIGIYTKNNMKNVSNF